MKLIYISGPYSNGDVDTNVENAVLALHEVMDAGHVAFCPHLSHYAQMSRWRPYNQWIEADLKLLSKCDALVRLPGDSQGAEIEVEFAGYRGIPVYYGMEAWKESLVIKSHEE